jgi:hypothetical protein
MNVLFAILGVLLLLTVLLDAFETIILPRQVTRRWRLARLFYRITWTPWSAVSGRMSSRNREWFLSFYGPLSFVLLLVMWGLLLLFGFAFLHFAAHSVPGDTALDRFGNAIYFSGTTLFTLGLGDVAAHTIIGRALTILETFIGLGFLAIVVGYFPVLYQAFSRREAQISLLDARAGSPPSATEMLRRHATGFGQDELYTLLREWERWSAELLESHLSYPVLCFFRSQHNNESWLASLATILDLSALVLVGIEGSCKRQAQMTFAMARHAIVDLTQVLGQTPDFEICDRLTTEELKRMRTVLAESGVILQDGSESGQRLADLREMYEPYIVSMSRFLRMDLPKWVREGRPDNWQTSAWGRITGTRNSQLTVERHL